MTRSTVLRRLSYMVAILALALPVPLAQEEPPDSPVTGAERAALAQTENLDRQIGHLEALMIEAPEAAQSGLGRALEAITSAMLLEVLAGLPEGPPSALLDIGPPDLPAGLQFPNLPDLPEVVTLPELPTLPEPPDLPELPELPDLPERPDLPDVPNGP